MATRVPRVLIFDSGVGGLSILDCARRALPHCHYDYLSDNAGFPYGDKADATVRERTLETIRRFLHQRGPVDVIVVACNTASTVALPALREAIEIPIVGVVPAIKPAAARSANRYIGLLATPGTIARPYTRRLIGDFASDCRVVTAGSTALVRLAERRLRGERITPEAVAPALQPFMTTGPENPNPEQLDQMVLACTHFPLLAEPIRALMGPSVSLVDSGEAIARRITYWLEQLGLALQGPSPGPEGVACFSAEDANLQALVPALKQRRLGQLVWLTRARAQI